MPKHHFKGNAQVRKARYERQKLRTIPNKIRKMLKHLRKQPNDNQTKSAIDRHKS